MEYKQGELDIIDIRENPKIIDWTNTCEHHILTEKFIEEFKDYLDWEYIAKYQNINEDLVFKYALINKLR